MSRIKGWAGITFNSKQRQQYLHPKNAKDDEESTANEDNVSNGLEGRNEGLDNQLEAWGTAYNPEKEAL